MLMASDSDGSHPVALCFCGTARPGWLGGPVTSQEGTVASAPLPADWALITGLAFIQTYCCLAARSHH